nr:hypothetical protein Iba_chr02bCG6930 [Ipomoea batatas]
MFSQLSGGTVEALNAVATADLKPVEALKLRVDSATAVTELVSGSGVGSSEVGLSLPTIAVLETWTVANWQNGKWLGNYYLLLPFCNLPVWTVGAWNYEARTNG